MITKFVIEKNRPPDFRGATQNIPDTVTVLMPLEPFKIGTAACGDHNDVRIQAHYGVMIGVHRESHIHIKVVNLCTEPVRNPADFAAPTCCCCQDNLSTEAVVCLK